MALSKSERQKRWRESHKEQIAAYNAEWRKNNREHINAYMRGYKRSPESKERRDAMKKEYDHAHPENVRARSALYKARKKAAEGSFTDEQWLALCAEYGQRCAYCGEEKLLETDHVVPITKGGTNWISNIVPACKNCNASKGTKLLGEWIPPLDRLAVQ